MTIANVKGEGCKVSEGQPSTFRSSSEKSLVISQEILITPTPSHKMTVNKCTTIHTIHLAVCFPYILFTAFKLFTL
jgi:hypothetical protein